MKVFSRSIHTLFVGILFAGVTLFSSVAYGMQLQMQYTINPRVLDAQAIQEIEAIIGYTFKDKELLKEVFTTAARDPKRNYERREYLGDSILGYIVDRFLFERYPNAKPGMMTAANSEVTKQEPQVALCLKLGLHQYIQHNKREIGAHRLCDVIEALVGVLLEDGGPEVATKFVFKFFTPMMQGQECPCRPSQIIDQFARSSKQDITYTWNNNQCQLVCISGVGKVDRTLLPVGNDSKKDPVRLGRYLAEREFVANNIPLELSRLVCLPIEAGYQVLQGQIDQIQSIVIPCLSDATWVEGIKGSSQERLHTLMQKFGSNTPQYDVRETSDERDSRFTCTLTIPAYLVQPCVSHAATKQNAREETAKLAYLEIQKTVILSRDIARIPNMALQLYTNNPIVSLYEFCQKQELKMPLFQEFFKEKNGTKHMYYRVTAPWLAFEIKGSSREAGDEAKRQAAQRIIKIMGYVSQSCIEPKKLATLKMLCGDTPNQKQLLMHLCSCYELQDPTIESHICEGPVLEGLRYEATASIPNTTWCKRSFSAIAGNKADAERSAAKKAALHIANKMIREELK